MIKRTSELPGGGLQKVHTTKNAPKDTGLEQDFYINLEKMISQLDKHFVGEKENEFTKLCIVVAKEQLEIFVNAIKTVIDFIYDKSLKVFLPIYVTEIGLKNGAS
jgi:hypothetical protein